MDTTSRRFASIRWVLARDGDRKLPGRSGEPSRGVEADLDALGEFDLLGGGQQLRPADESQVGADRVDGCHQVFVGQRRASGSLHGDRAS
jgi:hypothetical protein